MVHTLMKLSVCLALCLAFTGCDDDEAAAADMMLGAGGEGGEAVADGIDAAHRAALVAEREAEPGWMFDSVSSAGGGAPARRGIRVGIGIIARRRVREREGPEPWGRFRVGRDRSRLRPRPLRYARASRRG